MPITLGDTTITGLSAGGLPDSVVVPDDFETSFNLVGKTLTMPATVSTPSQFEIGLSGSYSADTWYGFATNSVLTSGIYYIKCFMDTYFAIGQHYSMTYASVPFYFFAGGSNNTQTFDLPVLYGNGHTSNSQAPLRFRIREQAAVNGGQVHIDWLPPGYSVSGLNGTGGRNIIINLIRMSQ